MDWSHASEDWVPRGCVALVLALGSGAGRWALVRCRGVVRSRAV